MAKRYEATEAFFDRAFSAYQGPYKNGTATPTQIEEIADWLLTTYEILQRKAKGGARD